MADDLMHDDQKLNEYLTHIREQNNANLFDILGFQKTGKGYRFDFFNRQILFDHQDFIDLSGEELSLSGFGWGRESLSTASPIHKVYRKKIG
jgi:hypothetical protein